MDKNILRTFSMPITRIEVPQPFCSEIEKFMKQYWIWKNDHWEIRADWIESGKCTTCSHIETPYAWEKLQEAACLFGFEK